MRAPPERRGPLQARSGGGLLVSARGGGLLAGLLRLLALALRGLRL
jgi:hypothetical protein